MSVTTTHPLLQDSLMRPVPRLCFGLKVKRLDSGGGASVPIGKGALLAPCWRPVARPMSTWPA